MQQDITEFQPYFVQLVAQLLERRGDPVPDNYLQILPSLLQQSVWAAKANQVLILILFLNLEASVLYFCLVHSNPSEMLKAKGLYLDCPYDMRLNQERQMTRLECLTCAAGLDTAHQGLHKAVFCSNCRVRHSCLWFRLICFYIL